MSKLLLLTFLGATALFVSGCACDEPKSVPPTDYSYGTK